MCATTRARHRAPATRKRVILAIVEIGAVIGRHHIGEKMMPRTGDRCADENSGTVFRDLHARGYTPTGLFACRSINSRSRRKRASIQSMFSFVKSSRTEPSGLALAVGSFSRSGALILFATI